MGYRLRVIGYGLWVMALLLTACQQQGAVEGNAVLRVELQADGLDSIRNIVFTAHDINMDKYYEDSTLTMTLPVGYYDLSIKAISNGKQVRAYQRGVKVTRDIVLPLQAIVLRDRKDFVLAEIFFAGTETPEGKRYLGDKYFVVYNNSNDTLSADGLVLIEADLNSVQKYELTPDFRSAYFAVDAMYRIPGDGRTYRVAPGQAILIADNAMDHTEANTRSFDLSQADFEWYDVSSSAGISDVDNPAVPNMEKIYCYTYTIWVPHNQGHKSFGLARFPEGMTDEDYFANDAYYIRYEYEIVTAAGAYKQSKKSYVLPNEWIVDAVNLAPKETFQWLTISDTLDAGYTYVAPTGSDKTRFGKAVRRKTLEETNGHRILQDSNNSTEDFETAVTADPYYFKR